MATDEDGIEFDSTWYNDADIALRSKAVYRLSTWAGTLYEYPFNQDNLAHLLGYADYHRMLMVWNPEIRRKLELLVGEHGYIVYKMLLARK